MRWTIGLLTVITLTLTWSQLMTISAAQQKLQQQSTSGLESLTSVSPSDVGGSASSTAGSSTTATAKTNPTITTTGTPTASDAKAQQQPPSPTPGSLASSLLSGMIIINYISSSFFLTSIHHFLGGSIVIALITRAVSFKLVRLLAFGFICLLMRLLFFCKGYSNI
jgi:hypothetical protein